MDIYFIDISKIYNSEKSKNNKIQHKVGRLFLKYLLEKNYNLKSEIKEENGKPYLENNPIFFNISHSNNLVGIVFDKDNIGIDVEYNNKNRNYKLILKHYKIESNNISQKEFYQMWTVYEAEYKSGIKKNLKSFEYDDYTVSISYKEETDVNYFEINILNEDILEKDLEECDFELLKINKNTIKYLKTTSVKL